MNVNIETIYQIVSGGVALVGFVLSLIQTIARSRDNRRNITFCIINITRSKADGEFIIVRYRIDNLSSKSISVVGVRLIFDDEEYPAHFISIFAEKYDYGGKDLYVKLTDVLPITLGANDSHGGYLSFRIPKEKIPDPKIPVTLVISTNHGKPVKKTLSLNQNIRIR